MSCLGGRGRVGVPTTKCRLDPDLAMPLQKVNVVYSANDTSLMYIGGRNMNISCFMLLRYYSLPLCQESLPWGGVLLAAHFPLESLLAELDRPNFGPTW